MADDSRKAPQIPVAAEFFDRLVDSLHREGTVPPPWLVYVLITRREVERTGDAGNLPPEVVLACLECLVKDLPAETKTQALRALLDVFARKLDDAGIPHPRWVRVGRERWGGRGGET